MMKRIETNKLITGLLALALIGGVTGCQKGLYDPEAAANRLPPKDNYFDFKLTGNVQLSVNYDIPGLKSIIEVYDQDPMKDHKTKKDDLTPIYVAYVNDGKYEGIMNIPTAVKEAYVYTNSLSAPRCVKLNVVANGFAFDAAQANPDTRVNLGMSSPGAAVGLVDVTKFPYEVAAKNGGKRSDNLFSITAWNPIGWECINLSYYNRKIKLGAEDEKVGDVSGRVEAFLNAQRKIDNNKSLLRNPEQLNMKVPATATDGMAVEITHMGEHCSFFNTFGYYYYEDKGTTLTPEEFWKIKKYILIPHAKTFAWGEGGYGGVQIGETVKLLYFDKDGNKSEKFPPNYVIGWFLIANGYGSNPPTVGVGGRYNYGIIQDLPVDAYTSAAKYSSDRYTCMSDDKGNDRRFISLYDNKSKLRVIGIEDYTTAENQPDDYMDLMFVVKTTPDLGGGELPPIGSEDPKPDPAVWPVKGTLAFEDIWPMGGDYDLNDVIVEYNRDIVISDNNKVLKITETFKPVQKGGSALNDNFFACQFKNLGYISSVPDGIKIEVETNSVVITSSAKNTAGETYTIVRDLANLNLDQTAVKEDFNPYIIAKKYLTEKRIEIHLPQYDMTSAADEFMMNSSNAHYIDKDGIFPFAINIPIIDFIPADETKRIDQEGQYPSFAKWAVSKGTECEDWYLQDKGKK